jgi:hypothetical protein
MRDSVAAKLSGLHVGGPVALPDFSRPQISHLEPA